MIVKDYILINEPYRIMLSEKSDTEISVVISYDVLGNIKTDY